MELATGWKLTDMGEGHAAEVHALLRTVNDRLDDILADTYGAAEYHAQAPSVRSQAALILLTQAACAPALHPGGFNVVEIAHALGMALGKMTAHLDDVELGFTMRYVGMGVQNARAESLGPATEGEA